MQNGLPGIEFGEDVVLGRPLSPVAPRCHTADLSAVLAQKERSR